MSEIVGVLIVLGAGVAVGFLGGFLTSVLIHRKDCPFWYECLWKGEKEAWRDQ